MDFTWIVFLGFAIFFTYKGFRQGLLATIARLASFVAGYVASLLWGKPTAAFLERTTSLDGIVAFVVAAIGVFIAASFAVNFIFSRWAKRIKAKKGEELSTASSLLGAGLGLCIGSAVAFFMIFSMTFMQDLLLSKPNAMNNSQQGMASAEQSVPKNFVEKTSQAIAGRVVSVVAESSDMDPTAAKVADAFVQNPKAIMDNIQGILNSPDTQSLFNDPENQRVLESNNPDEIKALDAFQSMVDDPKMQKLALASGFGVDDQEAFETVLAETMGSMWGRAQAVKNDQRFQEIYRDPEFRERLKNKNPMALIADPNFMELVKILTSAEEPPRTSSSSHESGSASSEVNSLEENFENSSVKPAPVIHRWIDENGQVHFSDEKSE